MTRHMISFPVEGRRFNYRVAAIIIVTGAATLSDGMQLQLSAALTDARGNYLTRPITWASAICYGHAPTSEWSSRRTRCSIR